MGAGIRHLARTVRQPLPHSPRNGCRSDHVGGGVVGKDAVGVDGRHGEGDGAPETRGQMNVVFHAAYVW